MEGFSFRMDQGKLILHPVVYRVTTFTFGPVFHLFAMCRTKLYYVCKAITFKALLPLKWIFDTNSLNIVFSLQSKTIKSQHLLYQIYEIITLTFSNKIQKEWVLSHICRDQITSRDGTSIYQLLRGKLRQRWRTQYPVYESERTQVWN